MTDEFDGSSSEAAPPDERSYRSGGNWMWICADGVHRITCPECGFAGGGGVLYRIEMRGSDDVFLCCDECEALWEQEHFRWDDDDHGKRSLSSMMDERGLVWDDVVWLDREPGCVICRDGGPLDVIADLPTTWVTAPPSAPLPGYICVVAKRHVAEPFELDEPEFTAFWKEAMAVAAALDELLQPSKMNYEIHGNTIRHVHLHLFPRFAGDPFEGGPIDGRIGVFDRSPEDIGRLKAAIATVG
jgi:diadenosine tetraphosphate (Ap4A) HIT family hydrolase